uniref:Uncharacterized protein n=1 Tax=Panagrellus redivivus TaxID=6233 RepID=A0A7E4VMX6_PANRE
MSSIQLLTLHAFCNVTQTTKVKWLVPVTVAVLILLLSTGAMINIVYEHCQIRSVLKVSLSAQSVQQQQHVTTKSSGLTSLTTLSPQKLQLWPSVKALSSNSMYYKQHAGRNNQNEWDENELTMLK